MVVGEWAMKGSVQIVWWAAVLAGASFMLPVLAGWDGSAIIAWKGAGVGLLALWAAMQAKDANPAGDGWLIAAILALGALGDVLLDAVGLEKGAIAFALGHMLAIWLYARNRRPSLSGSQRLLALVTIPGSVVIVWALLAPLAGWWHAAIYTVFVAAMAAMAWTSRFPRYRVGLGAMMFLASDLIIFAGQGPWAGTIWPDLLIWPLYFGGQALIAWGVVTTLRTVGPGKAEV